jgi:hypothetical protein
MLKLSIPKWRICRTQEYPATQQISSCPLAAAPRSKGLDTRDLQFNSSSGMGVLLQNPRQNARIYAPGARQAGKRR